MSMLADVGASGVLAILVGLLGLGLAVVQFIVVQRLTLVPVIVACWVMTLLCGAFGVAWSAYEAGHAVAMVDPADRAMLLARGVSGALGCGILAAILAIVQTVVGGAAITARGLLAPASGPKGGQP